MMDRTAATAVPLLAVALLAWKYASAPARLPLPPGPKRRPLIGNLTDLPAESPWLTYHEWAKTYGEVLSVEVLGQPIVIVTSAAAAEELFERRSAIYSDRPRLVMIAELMGFDFTFAMIRYGEMWRQKRRVMHKYVNHKVSPSYQGMQLHESHAFVAKLLDDPQDFLAQVNQYIIHTITSVVYGMQRESDVQHFAALGQESMDYSTEAAIPGRYLVDTIPAMKYIPAWFPGAKFRKTATHVRHLIREMLDKPWKTVQEEMAAGTAIPSMVTEMIKNGEDESLAKENAGSVFVAGLDTTHSAVGSFFFVLTKYPEVQKKAQAELDAVVGSSRLPDFADRERLPYIHALISELWRRYPVTPWGVPHGTTAEDVYNGYRIPKGSIVIGNAWSMLNDPEDYPEPEVFKPERFLKLVDGQYVCDESVRDPRTVQFGFGRRICPGRFIAEQSLYAAVVAVLATCDISAPVDSAGNPAYPQESFTTGMVMGPKPFKCVIKPRSKEAVDLIQSSLPSVRCA